VQVFSALVAHAEGDNPTWYRHADYWICDAQEKRIKHVDNATGHYERAPRFISLPPGRYFIRAPAKNYLTVEVPVVIQSGRLTRIHLDGEWRPPADTSGAKLVTLPNGYPIGWRAGPAKAAG